MKKYNNSLSIIIFAFAKKKSSALTVVYRKRLYFKEAMFTNDIKLSLIIRRCVCSRCLDVYKTILCM